MAKRQNKPSEKLAYPQYSCVSERSRQIVRTLHEAFARELSVQLAAYLRCAVEVKDAGFAEYTFGEFLDKRPAHSCTCSLGCPGWDALTLVNAEPGVLFPLLELMLGGKPQESSPARELTDIEKNLMVIPLRSIAEKLDAAWARVTNLNCRLNSIEDTMSLPRVLSREAPLLAANFDLTVADHTGRFSLLLPAPVIEQTVQTYMAAAEPAASTRSDEAQISALMLGASLRIEVSIERVSMELRDLLNLREGYVVKFDHARDRDVDASINGRPGFKGQVVSTGRRRAFLVSGTVPETP